MAKKDKNASFKTVILFLCIIFVVVLAYLSGTKGKMQPSIKTITNQPTMTIQKSNNPIDIDQAQDQLNKVNVDSVDSGINQLNSQVSSF